eukprot:jgi/Botrbrau1/13877/Bobra.0056s0109.1
MLVREAPSYSKYVICERTSNMVPVMMTRRASERLYEILRRLLTIWISTSLYLYTNPVICLGVHVRNINT